MTYWKSEHRLIDEKGRNVCSVFWDEDTKSWAFEDYRGKSEFGFRTSEEAITYCDEYIWNAYGM